ncbi:hypothetical protein ACQBAT_09405 [Ornithinimicrobium sp. Y1847]|uniref:hypothetical protein n=1 Tax=Ornithinimicrobium sp. Y1847 TaxID=3405419 RepID=UPI003B6850BE
MPLFRRRKVVIGDDVPPPTTKPDAVPREAMVPLERGESLLASAQEDADGHWLLLTTWRLLERSEQGETVVERAWHEIDTGAWNPDSWTLAVSFVGGGGRQWGLRRRTGPGSVPQVFRERTSASVVLTRSIDLGPRRSARVSIRTVLRTRELVEQVLLGKETDPEDAELSAEVLQARQDLRTQVGLDPVR